MVLGEEHSVNQNIAITRTFHFLAVLDTNDIVDNVFLAGFFIIHQVHLFFLLSFLSSFLSSPHASIHHSSYKHILALELALNLQGNREKMILDPALGDHEMCNRARTLEYLEEQPKEVF